MNSIKVPILNFNYELAKLKCNLCKISNISSCEENCNKQIIISVVLKCNYIIPLYDYKNVIIYYVKDNGAKLLVPLSDKNGYLIEIFHKNSMRYIKIRTGDCSLAIEYKNNKLIKYKCGKYEIVFN